jgi:hypothetical protein
MEIEKPRETRYRNTLYGWDGKRDLEYIRGFRSVVFKVNYLYFAKYNNRGTVSVLTN